MAWQLVSLLVYGVVFRVIPPRNVKNSSSKKNTKISRSAQIRTLQLTACHVYLLTEFSGM